MNHRVSIVVGVSLALAAAVLASLAWSAPATKGLPDCLGKPVVRPVSITVYCADAGEVVQRIVWSSWGETTSVGQGNATYNDCKPSCVQGHDHMFRARLTVFGTQRCPSGRAAYRSLRLTAIHGEVKPVTMPFRCNDAIARNLDATASVKAALRATFLAHIPSAQRAKVRGPLAGQTYYGSYGAARYALAVFSLPLTGSTDQPEVFVEPAGRSWIDRGDTGGCLGKIPAALLVVWRLGPATC